MINELAADDELRRVTRSVIVEVEDQRMRLRGYVTDRQEADRVLEVVRSVPGVLSVDQGIISDDELARAVSQAISRDPRTSAATVEVAAHHGHLDIVGEVPDPMTLRRLEGVARSVPGVLAVRVMAAVRQAAGVRPG